MPLLILVNCKTFNTRLWMEFSGSLCLVLSRFFAGEWKPSSESHIGNECPPAVGSFIITVFVAVTINRSYLSSQGHVRINWNFYWLTRLRYCERNDTFVWAILSVHVSYSLYNIPLRVCGGDQTESSPVYLSEQLTALRLPLPYDTVTFLAM